MPNWKKVITSGSDAVLTSVTATAGFTGSLLGTASFATTASYVSSNFQYEIHVSQIDGNDTTGDGSLLKPVATVTKALTLLSTSRKTIIIHPGTYSENVTVADTNTTISTSELTGANTLLSGTLTIGTLGSGTRISGLKMRSLVISGTAQAYISNCTVDNQVTKSSSGYVEIINSELQCILGIQISGAGITIINGNKNVAVSVSNASAQVIIKGCNSVVTPSATAGNLAIVDCIVTALGGNAITITGASTTLTLANSQVLVTAGNNVAPISVAGIYSIINTVYDKPGSSLTGISTNSIDYFQYIDADNVNTKGLSVTGSTITSGSFTSYGSFIVADQMGIGSADLGAARILRDHNGKLSVNYRDRFLHDDANVTAVDYLTRRLYDKYTSASINWGTRVLTDSTEVSALDWENRVGYAGGITTLDWGNLALIDTGGVGAIDWRNRILLDGTGTSRLNWINATAPSQILINAYSTNNIGLTTEAEPLANYSNYGNAFTPSGEIINGVTFDVGVSDYDLVSLKFDGTWVQSSMTSQDAFKMLGIAFNVGLTNSVLLEGHMVVSSGSNGAPKVTDLTIGRAVYMNTTSSGIFMSNTAPVATGQAVRLLGHVYYNSTNDATWYVMKFRPSHDWVTL